MTKGAKFFLLAGTMFGVAALSPATYAQNTSEDNLKSGITRRKLDSKEFSSQSFCGQWQGLLSGNDPEVQILLELECADDESVTGKLTWSSQRSGHNVRQLSGFFDRKEGKLILKDDRLLSSDANKRWYFCVIERYELKISADRKSLEGSYTAPACHDKGSVKLRRPTNPAAEKNV